MRSAQILEYLIWTAEDLIRSSSRGLRWCMVQSLCQMAVAEPACPHSPRSTLWSTVVTRLRNTLSSGQSESSPNGNAHTGAVLQHKKVFVISKRTRLFWTVAELWNSIHSHQTLASMVQVGESVIISLLWGHVHSCIESLVLCGCTDCHAHSHQADHARWHQSTRDDDGEITDKVSLTDLKAKHKIRGLWQLHSREIMDGILQ